MHDIKLFLIASPALLIMVGLISYLCWSEYRKAQIRKHGTIYVAKVEKITAGYKYPLVDVKFMLESQETILPMRGNNSMGDGFSHISFDVYDTVNSNATVTVFYYAKYPYFVLLKDIQKN